MNDTLSIGSVLRYPRGTPGTGVGEIDLSEILHLEARKIDVAHVTKTTAPELMTAMERGYSIIATRILPGLSWELLKAKEALEERKAVVILDEAPRILLEKKLVTTRNPGGSQEQREAVLELDGEYKALRNTVDMLEAVRELMKGKLKGFEMSFTSIRKTFDSLHQYGTLANSSPGDFSSGIPDDVELGGELSSTVGKPRY